jgi:TonB family protein
MPDIPAKAMRTISGTVRFSLRLHVDPQGKVTDAAIDNAGPSPYFVNLALKSVDSWRFNPPVANGQPAPSVWSLQYAITQAGTEVTPTQETP